MGVLVDVTGNAGSATTFNRGEALERVEFAGKQENAAFPFGRTRFSVRVETDKAQHALDRRVTLQNAAPIDVLANDCDLNGDSLTIIDPNGPSTTGGVVQ